MNGAPDGEVGHEWATRRGIRLSSPNTFPRAARLVKRDADSLR